MAGHRYPIVAREGLPLLIAAAVVGLIGLRLQNGWLLGCGAALLGLMGLLFRDPARQVPSSPLAVVSPVDGRVIKAQPTDRFCLHGEGWRIDIRIDHFGAYTARSPTEGRVLNLRDNVTAGSRLHDVNGLWLRTDEGDDVVLMLRGPKRLLGPRALVGYGERLGQGQRCANLRLARRAEVYLPGSSRLEVKTGQYVRAGTDPLATLVHK